jgi:glycosyltransferase involved in cell wall biosynthesis
MKVAVVYYGLPPEGGGAHTFGGSLLEAIRTAEPTSRHSFRHYSAGGGEPPSGVTAIPFTRRERYRRRAVYSLRDAQDRAGMPRSRRLKTWLDREIEEQGYDLVWFATNYAEDCDVPFIFTVLDVEHVRQPWFPEVSRNGLWEQRHHYFSRYIPKATRVIVPNPAGADQIMHAWGINQERILCLGHPTPRFALKAASEPLPTGPLEALGVKRPYLFYPAQFWAHKNHPLLFDALAELNQTAKEPYQLVMVGSDKGELERMQNLARALGVAEQVLFLGFVDDESLVSLYRNAHALTYVSRFGPENLPPLEAMALGCPVVVAAVPGAREQMRDAALLVAPDEPAELVQAVQRLEDAPLRDQLIDRGRERAGEWTADDYVAGVINFLDEFERLRRAWS